MFYFYDALVSMSTNLIRYVEFKTVCSIEKSSKTVYSHPHLTLPQTKNQVSGEIIYVLGISATKCYVKEIIYSMLKK